MTTLTATPVCAHFATQYTRHKRGAILLAPPGTGKTTYVRQQPPDARHWVDQDELYAAMGLSWSDADADPATFRAQYERADRLSDEVRAYGFRVMGSLFWDYPADAVVLLPEAQHRAYVAQRTDLAWARVAEIRALLANQAAQRGTPVFASLGEAVAWVDTAHPRVSSA